MASPQRAGDTRAPRALARCDPPRLRAGPGLRFLLSEPRRSPPRKLGKTGETWESRAETHPDVPSAPKRLPTPRSLGSSSFTMNLAHAWR